MSWAPPAPAQRGFTLVELMVAIAVLAVLVSLAVPSMTEALLGSKLSSYANSLSSSALLSRSEAIKRNVPVTLCASSGGTSCESVSWEQGWIVVSGTTVIHRQEAAQSGLRIVEADGKASLVFRPASVGTTTAAFTVCRASPAVGAVERVVEIGATGRTSVRSTSAGSCP